MSVFFSSFLELKEKFKVFAFDQWGVLHDGTKPYNGAIECIKNLSKNNATIFILTNSGKREKENLIRISNIGFDLNYITKVISSGETLWNSIASHDLPFKISYPINFSDSYFITLLFRGSYFVLPFLENPCISPLKSPYSVKTIAFS